MISGLADSVLVTFIVFCRIGACLMLVPGYSSVNVPAQVRLFVALVTTFALTPILISVLKHLTDNAAPLTLALLICSELLLIKEILSLEFVFATSRNNFAVDSTWFTLS